MMNLNKNYKNNYKINNNKPKDFINEDHVKYLINNKYYNL